MEYPELAARTRRFTRGAPRAVTVARDGARVLFLRSGGPEDPAGRLWSFDVATATERLVADAEQLLDADGTGPVIPRPLPGIDAYATDP
ncbi:MAG TPA: peptidase S9, partial [Micromonosporaceae bacterium]|nr:peptidase S9 [Micromonosporaceae bacterium]